KIALAVGITENIQDHGLKPTIFRRILNRKNQWATNFIQLFAAYEKNRPFKGLSNEACRNISEIGLYLAKNPESYEDNRILSEINFFIQSNAQHSELKNISYSAFLFKVFSEHTESKIDLEN